VSLEVCDRDGPTGAGPDTAADQTPPRVLRIEIRDDGVGFDPDERAIRSRRLGLTSMSERAHALGGRLTIESSPDAGTTVRAEVPLA